jgi:Rhamnan synthesis protein F
MQYHDKGQCFRMVPLWKVKREIRRIRRQALARASIIPAFLRRVWYDVRWPRHLRVTHGVMPPSPHMAIFLIYQPGGIAASIHEAIAALQASGPALLIVSNLPLSDDDRAYLAARAWRVIERPNLGYDFGGYREGVAQLHAARLDVRELWILNDSAWFPATVGQSPFRAMIDPAADVSGGMFRFHKRGKQHQWIESYFLSFTEKALRHPSFRQFWNRYPFMDQKYAVVRHGEMGIGRKLRNAGLTLHSKMSNALFLVALQDQSPEFLRKTLLYGGLVRDYLQVEHDALLAACNDGPAWRDAALAHIEATLKYGEFYYEYPYAAVHLMGFPFIKKGPDPRYMMWRRRYLEAARAGDLPPLPPAILAELEAAVAVDAQKDDVDWRYPAG